jgi:hypothetical protein
MTLHFLASMFLVCLWYLVGQQSIHGSLTVISSFDGCVGHISFRQHLIQTDTNWNMALLFMFLWTSVCHFVECIFICCNWSCPSTSCDMDDMLS